jgi:hypothetical protein
VTAPDVRVISRGITGAVLLRGEFRVVHKELTEDGRVALTCDELDAAAPRRIQLVIEAAVLEEIPAADSPVSSAAAELAQNRVLTRTSL